MDESGRLRRRSYRMGPNGRTEFVPYATMFKIEDRPNSDIAIDPNPRELRCVSCYHSLKWNIYRLAPSIFDTRCPDCKVAACDFWKDKPHLAVPKE